MLLRGGVPLPPPPLSTYVFTFSSFFLFPSEKHRGWGLRGWVSVQSWIGHGWKKKKKKNPLAGVQQVRCVYDNGRVSLVLLIAGGGFIGTGKRMRRRGDMKCVCCQGRFCELAWLGPLSLSLPQLKSPERSGGWKHITSVWTVASRLHCAV